MVQARTLNGKGERLILANGWLWVILVCSFSSIFGQIPCNQTCRVSSVVPQPISRDGSGFLVQARDEIYIYFHGLGLDAVSAEDVNLYQLVATQGTLTNSDDQVFTPISAIYEPSPNRVILTFSMDLAHLKPGPDIFRLQIQDGSGLREPPQSMSGLMPGDTFLTASNLGTLSAQPFLVDSDISSPVFPLDLPGSDLEPGHSTEQHIPSGGDAIQGIQRQYFNFQNEYGEYPLGTALFNSITNGQKDLVRDAICRLGQKLGVTLIESETFGITVAVGDMRAADPGATNGPGGTMAAHTADLLVFDSTETWDAFALGNFQEAFFFNFGEMLGLGATPDLPPPGMMDPDGALAYGQPIAREFPGNQDVIHMQHLYRPESSDIDLYQFDIDGVSPVRVVFELFAARMEPDASPLDGQLKLFQLDPGTGQFREMARNSRFFGPDPFLDLELEPGTYQIGVSSWGNDDFDPSIPGSGFGGTTEGSYELLIDRQDQLPALLDDTQQAFDGNGDGHPGGFFDFWFCVQTEEETLFVDKVSDPDAGQPQGTLSNPYNMVDEALASAGPGVIVRITANGGDDGLGDTLFDNYAYEFGYDTLATELQDGPSLQVPKDVCVMVDPGVIFKMRQSYIGVGSQTATDNSGGSLQILGANDLPVTITSYHDESIGVDTFPTTTTPIPGDWGGIRMDLSLDRANSRVDPEALGQFVNTVAQCAIFYGGGSVLVGARNLVIAPLHMVDTRPSIWSNVIEQSATDAMAITPNSFRFSRFTSAGMLFTPDFERRGPWIYANLIGNNAGNDLRILTTSPSGGDLPLTGTGLWDDCEITHVLRDTLVLENDSGRYEEDGTTFDLSHKGGGTLIVHPGMVVKLDSASIIVSSGGALLAEGSESQPIYWTSMADDDIGDCSTYDTNNDGLTSSPQPGDWGGLLFSPSSQGSLYQNRISFGGGVFNFNGSFLTANAVEIHQAAFRIANSYLSENDPGTGGNTSNYRSGFGENGPGIVYSAQCQPIILSNLFQNNLAPAISIGVNDLSGRPGPDVGAQTLLMGIDQPLENHGPLVRGNVLQNNTINGMKVRGGTLTAQSVWDDTDIVHVLEDPITIHNFHSSGGLRLQSQYGESLVVKGNGGLAGFNVTGGPLSISDRIGGMFHMVGLPNAPVILTSIHDDQFGAGLDMNQLPQKDTNNNGSATLPSVGDWSGVVFDSWAHDRAFGVYVEHENPDPGVIGSNDQVSTAEPLGFLNPAGSQIPELGFEIHGVIHRTDDTDVYQFSAKAGTEFWLDIDRSRFALDSKISLIHNGNVVASSDNSWDEAHGLSSPTGIGLAFSSTDFWTWNPKDAGMLVVLPGAPGYPETYQVRVEGYGQESQGRYELQLRFQAVDDFPGSFCAPPIIESQPADISSCGGNPIAIDVQARASILYAESNSQELSYQWYKDGEIMPGEVSDTLTLADPQSGDTGIYQVLVSDSCGTTPSREVVINTDVAVAINPTSIPQGVNPIQMAAEFTCMDPGRHWEWNDLTNGQTFGQDQPTVELPILSETTYYEVLVTNGIGSGLATHAVVLVATDPMFIDVNSDGCNTLDDLNLLLNQWRLNINPDANGDGFMDIRDYLYINTSGECQ